MTVIGDVIARGVSAMAGRRSPWGSGGNDGQEETGPEGAGPSAEAGDPAAFGAAGARIVDHRAAIRDFGDTAALIASLDLVIAPDTAVTHVAGALGVPVWQLDRYNSCWRWRLAPDASPWYPTLRIFRQERFGDWSAAVARVSDALRAWRPAPRA